MRGQFLHRFLRYDHRCSGIRKPALSAAAFALLVRKEHFLQSMQVLSARSFEAFIGNC